MKFDEKLIILRKKAMLSQEQLAEKLDVTRQTVSKWELGQTKPDIDKLRALSELFEIDINELTNDEISLQGNENEKKEKNDNKKSNVNKDGGDRKIILYLLIIIFVASLSTLVYRVGCDLKEKKDAIMEEINKTNDDAKRKQEEILKKQEEMRQEMEMQEQESKKSSFNFSFETYQGTQSGTVTGWEVDKIIKNNKQNNGHLIEVIFDGVSYGTDSDKIKEIKNSLNDNFTGSGFQKYEISIDYDSDGYVNKITIETR